MLETWPEEVAASDRRHEIHNVLEQRGRRGADRRPYLRALFRLERRREPAHRAQPRLWGCRDALIGVLLRLESIGYVVLGAIAAAGAWLFSIVFGPLLFWTTLQACALARAARRHVHLRALRGGRFRARSSRW